MFNRSTSFTHSAARFQADVDTPLEMGKKWCSEGQRKRWHFAVRWSQTTRDKVARSDATVARRRALNLLASTSVALSSKYVNTYTVFKTFTQNEVKNGGQKHHSGVLTAGSLVTSTTSPSIPWCLSLVSHHKSVPLKCLSSPVPSYCPPFRDNRLPHVSQPPRAYSRRGVWKHLFLVQEHAHWCH